MRRMLCALRLLGGLLLFFLAEVAHDESGLSTGLAAVAASAAILLLCGALHAAAVRRLPSGRVRTAIRDRELRTAFLPQRDPDAAGRPRPRAPGRRPATAG